MNDIDIWRTAKLLIDQHGARAEFWAMGRELESIEAYDEAGVARWGRVFVAIEGLRKMAPASGEKVH